LTREPAGRDFHADAFWASIAVTIGGLAGVVLFVVLHLV